MKDEDFPLHFERVRRTLAAECAGRHDMALRTGRRHSRTSCISAAASALGAAGFFVAGCYDDRFYFALALFCAVIAAIDIAWAVLVKRKWRARAEEWLELRTDVLGAGKKNVRGPENGV